MKTHLSFRINLQLFAEEKTETATPRKREEVRKKGQVAKSGEVGTAILLLAGFYSIKAFLSYGTQRIGNVMIWFLEHATNWDGSRGSVSNIYLFILKECGLILLPIFAILMVAAIISQVLQVGFMFNFAILQPNFNRVNPIEGFKRIFSKRAMIEFFKSVLKIILIGFVVYYHIRTQIPWLTGLSLIELVHSQELIKSSIYDMALYIGLILLILAIFDYAFQRWEFEQNIKMTKQEVLEELKQMEGDPQIRSQIRQRQRQLASSRMMAAIPTADVIITNPTHYAIALSYKSDTMAAPQVVAKGVGLIAARIKEIGEEHSIPKVENPPLAKALYKTAEIGQQIPAELYPAVAEVLAFVYRLKRRSL